MQHAFLIIAHNNFNQLKKMIKLLDANNHDIYIHIDKKSKDFIRADFDGIAKKSKVFIYQEYKVYWGGFSQVQTETLLFEKAHKNHYDYYHLISGADLPLKSNKEIDLFFEQNKGKEFINFDEDKLMNDKEIVRRTKYYHFLQDYRRRYNQNWKNNIFTFLERISLLIQIIFHVDRVRNLDWTIKYGSQWVSITDSFVSEILRQKSKIQTIFSNTNCADELYKQTIAYNCGFKNNIYIPIKGMTQNVRFIDWSRGKNGNPYTFREKDKAMLMKNNNLFARKFSESIDREIIEDMFKVTQN